MANHPARPDDRPTPPPPRPYHPLAGILSYLVPGLGQIVQGRVAKGVLFLVCIYTLFFYGIYLGHVSTSLRGRGYSGSPVVYLPDASDPTAPRRSVLQALGTNLYNRPQFAGQFWVGVAAWPAIAQYLRYDRHRHLEAEDAHLAADREFEKAEGLLKEAAREEQNAIEFRARAKADPADEAELLQKATTARREAALAEEESAKHRETAAERERQLAHPLFGSFQREPSQAEINVLNNTGDKRLELAWVFTVIAGVLNILVIYDAVAGPAFVENPSKEKRAS
jgi:hypothetical protein